jgi:hypothetical protein
MTRSTKLSYSERSRLCPRLEATRKSPVDLEHLTLWLYARWRQNKISYITTSPTIIISRLQRKTIDVSAAAIEGMCEGINGSANVDAMLMTNGLQYSQI